jgi:hypothetical protein
MACCDCAAAPSVHRIRAKRCTPDADLCDLTWKGAAVVQCATLTQSHLHGRGPSRRQHCRTRIDQGSVLIHGLRPRRRINDCDMVPFAVIDRATVQIDACGARSDVEFPSAAVGVAGDGITGIQAACPVFCC